MKEKRFDYYTAISILPLLILILVFFLPLYQNLRMAFIEEGSFTIERVEECFQSAYNRQILLFTLKQAALSSLFSILFALPGAYLFSNYRFTLRKLILSISNLCFFLPSILVVLGFVIFYGNSGVLNTLLMKMMKTSEPPLKILYSFKAIILAHVFLNFPIALSLITDTWSHLSQNQENASLSMGASGLGTFIRVTLPRILPVILSAALLIFLFCFTSFSIILVLGGGPQFTTIEVEIYRLNNIVLDQEKAAALSVYSFTMNLICLTIYLLFSSLFKNKEKNRISRLRRPTSRLTYLAISLYILLMLIFFFSPLVSIVWRSFYSTSQRYGTGYTTRAYRELFGLESSIALANTLDAIMNSIQIAILSACVSTIISLCLALWISKRRKGGIFELLSMLPMAISSVTLGLGYSILRANISEDSILSGPVLVILAHTVIILPFCLRTLLPVLRSQNENKLNAAYTMGYGVMKASFDIEIPTIKSSIIRAFIFAFALSMGEVNATLTLARGKVSTLPLQIYRLINSYNYQSACAVGTILITITFIVFLLCEYLFREGER
ncbi:MAG: iron ABC transporter permease [Spirochaetales bacterium]|nr:iron ABC transporter permease [Spirochaetales bacterium]